MIRHWPNGRTPAERTILNRWICYVNTIDEHNEENLIRVNTLQKMFN